MRLFECLRFFFEESNHLIMPRHSMAVSIINGLSHLPKWTARRREGKSKPKVNAPTVLFFKQNSGCWRKNRRRSRIQCAKHTNSFFFNVAQDPWAFVSASLSENAARNFSLRTCFRPDKLPTIDRSRVSRALIKFQFQTKAFKMRLFNRSAASIVIV